ncbi:hypothetical protein PMIN01_13151 [Paraphaeosphaeria minitans]|uniref:Peptidase C15, pyroglutamyl peptidase I-like protein n=1 Tax=Paraphaeosphaeria minitans TaxID=565426 RepID=A0A9P6KJQ1_9PLEO|nr:hypothetical protein PMIN01_13151 [Paraphaeosphaeria minitans]
MPTEVNPASIKVLVTGFGPFLDITTNPSWETTKSLPIARGIFSLIAKHEPHIVLHMGLAVDRDYYAVEQSAPKEGYYDVSDSDRKVITRAENKKLFGKAPSSLATSLDLASA